MGIHQLLPRAILADTAVAVLIGWAARPSLAVTAGPSCGTQVETNNEGIAIRILFAKNGAVQRYEVVTSHENEEAANDFRLSLEARFGPAVVNAPPLRIVSFKKAEGGGMALPDKAIDSCGRTLSFN